MIWLTIIVYVLLLWGISYLFRKHSNVDEYLMAGREANTVQVAAGLFTLIGGGELVTMASLGFVYGKSGIALFVGYSAAFVFLGYIAGKIRKNSKENQYVSLPDYVHDNFGKASGLITFLFSFLAFFALLMLQFATAGTVISPFTDLSYNAVVFLIGTVVLVYLFLGGFRAVLATDVIQGVAMVVLLPLLAYVVFSSSSQDISTIKTESLPFAVWISMVVTGFFVASASADVWQRVYAAKNDSSAKNGLFFAGVLFFVFGFILVEIGISAREIGILDADNAFVSIVTTHLPEWASILTIIMVVSAVMSTSDTEIFLLTGMLQRELKQFPFILGDYSSELDNVTGARKFMIILSVFAILFSIVFSDLIDIYTWLLSAIVVISPIILFSLFWKASSTGMFLSLLGNMITFSILVFSGILDINNVYLICLPGLVFYAAALVFIDKQKIL